MEKYYLHINNKQEGPFSLEELKEKNISKLTPIWFEGIQNWTAAGEIKELQEFFRITSPPPFTFSSPTNQEEVIKDSRNLTTLSKKSKSSKIYLLVCVIVLTVILVPYILKSINNDYESGSADTKTYEEKVMTVEQIEKSNPSKFLNASGTYRQIFFGTNLKVEGEIVNKATVANYKDVTVEVIFYSETETELDRKQYTIYDYFPAHSKKSFKLKIEKPQSCTKLGWEAVNATAY